MINNECISLLKSRQSIRKFKDEMIPDADIEKIIEIGLKAPSAGNCQPWRIVIIKDKSKIQQLAEAAHGQSVVSSCSVLLAIIAVPQESAERYGERGSTFYVIQDTAALTYSLLLGAHFKGFGACWVGAFSDEKVSEILHTPLGYRPVALIPIGVPDESPELRKRKKSSEIIVHEQF